VATGSSDSTVKVWDGAQGTLQATLRGGNGNVIIACDISNGIVVGGGTDKTCRVWNARTERMVSGRGGRVATQNDKYSIYSNFQNLLLFPFLKGTPIGWSLAQNYLCAIVRK
jgi:WD40 repeat protein